jgi:hypothetical protein
MKLLLNVFDLITNQQPASLDCAYVHMTPELANAILDHRRIFLTAKDTPRPTLLWAVYADESAAFFQIPATTQGAEPSLPRRLRDQLGNAGALRLPDAMDPRFAESPWHPLLVSGADLHLIINNEGVNWGLLVRDRPVGTWPLPFALIEEAAGIKLRDDEKFPFPVAT